MIEIIEQHYQEIRALCRRYGVRRLGLFGSAATGEFDPDKSDLDFVATFADTHVPGLASRYLGFAEGLEALFGRSVDVITENMVRNPYFREAVEATRQPLCAEQDAPTAA